MVLIDIVTFLKWSGIMPCLLLCPWWQIWAQLRLVNQKRIKVVVFSYSFVFHLPKTFRKLKLSISRFCPPPIEIIEKTLQHVWFNNYKTHFYFKLLIAYIELNWLFLFTTFLSDSKHTHSYYKPILKRQLSN